MNDKEYIIAIDSGTQSIRAAFFDRHGNEIALSQLYPLQSGLSGQKYS